MVAEFGLWMSAPIARIELVVVGGVIYLGFHNRTK